MVYKKQFFKFHQARKAGLIVEGVITLIDREEGGRENIQKHVENIRSILTRTEIMAIRAKNAGGAPGS